MIEHGKLHFNIGQCHKDASPSTKKTNRIVASTSSENAGPPEGVPVVLLESVEFTMVILESKSRVTVTRSKRSKTVPDSTLHSPEDYTRSNPEGIEEVLSHEEPRITSEPHLASQLLVEPLRGRERLQPATVSNKRKRTSTISTVSPIPAEASALSEFQPIEMMIDAAMRISLCKRGSSNNLKIKANTFNEGLADVAPALWRPGYRSVRYVHPRAVTAIDPSAGTVPESSSRSHSKPLTGSSQFTGKV
jgi:hypothetical protein